MDGGQTSAKRDLGQERSFAKEVEKLMLGDGQVFHGEAIVAVTKGLLQAGVSYVGGYPGAPVSHLMDVLASARDTIMEPNGIYFEQSASEAGAAALLGASIHYPLRGAVTWKSIVGTNVASDALSNLSSSGVTGGAVIVIGDDYGEGASVIQERTLAHALKSSLPLIDPRYNLPTLVEMTEKAFELSEACHLPVMMSLRIRAAHMTGSFVCKDNKKPTYNFHDQLPESVFNYDKMVLPPSTYIQESEKFSDRLPAARRFIVEHGLNETFGDDAPCGIILQGGHYGVVLRALSRLGIADALGNSKIPLLVLNVVHPLVPEQITEFLSGKQSVLVVEEGSPAFIEDQVRAIAQQAAITCKIRGKDILPAAGEYIAGLVRSGIAAFLEENGPEDLRSISRQKHADIEREASRSIKIAQASPMPPRPPGFCIGCPERPIFTALKLLMRERGNFHVSSDIGCSTFSTLPPFNIGSTVLGYGLSVASGAASAHALGQPTVAVMGDGAFWHNGLTTGVAHSQWQGMDTVLVIMDNGYASATGQQHLPSTGSTPWGRPNKVTIEGALRGLGITWIKRADSYNVSKCMKELRKAMDAKGKGLRVIISDNECMLAKKRRGNKLKAVSAKAGKPVRTARFGVDHEVCTGDHSCMRLSGCPSLTLRPATDPLKDGPTAAIDSSCVACSLCGEAAQAAQLCPSFYRARGVLNPTGWQRFKARLNSTLLGLAGAS
ncbi:MAG: indolepyruvate ferredoxin oxidoreductase subunit alpha [Rhodospirillales bacterium]|nr:indolepyruvate ferredoxin oxidoreductase subunit alpha [Rhodospirillales bacterium]